MPDVRGLVQLLVGLIVCGAAAPARAYDFSVDVRTIGQGYQVRGFAPDGSNELLSRRRLTQYLDLNVFDIGPERWHGDDGGRNVFYVDASVRFDADFGGYMLGAPTGPNSIQELNQNELDILYAFLGGRNVGGHVDFQLGRQIHFDLIDFYAFDGADVLFHATRMFGVEAFAGTEVRGTLPLSSPIYELDGTSAGSRDPATRPAQNSEMAPMAGAALVAGAPGGPWSARLSFREIWSATADRQPGEPESGINQEVVSLTAMASWGNRVFLSGGLRYNVLFDELDDEQLALRVKLTPRQWLTLEHDFLAPTFDGDSIWNIFRPAPTAICAPLRDRASRVAEGLRAGSLGSTWRPTDEVPPSAPPPVPGRRRRGFGRAACGRWQARARPGATRHGARRRLLG